MKLNILLCDTFPGLLPENIPSYEWMFTSLFNKVRGDITYHIFEVYNEQLPTEFSSDDIYLITGSNVSAYDNIAWVNGLKKWIVEAKRQNVKIMGICFGHQIIAEALGGKVEKAKKGWGVGIRTSKVVDKMFATSFPNAKMRLLYNHHDQVTKLPSDATLIATSDFCPNEAYRIGTNIISLQGHPEFSEQYETHLLTDFPNDGESEDVKREALQTMSKEEPQSVLVANTMIKFLAEKRA